MSNLNYTIVGFEGIQTILVVHEGRMYTAADSHPSFDAILAGAKGDDVSILPLFDVAETIAATIQDEQLSERMRASHGRITFDGDPLPEALEATILRYLKEGDRARLAPLVAFVEKVMTNPNDHSRSQAYDWIANQSFTILENGNFLGAKGVYGVGEDSFKSTASGVAFVNGVEFKGQIPQSIDDEVTMPRSAVTHDPRLACSTGLHVGTLDYARKYGDRTVLVEVNPRDIVSIDGQHEKMRVCRYIVREDITDDTRESLSVSATSIAAPTCSFCGLTAAEGCEYVVAD